MAGRILKPSEPLPGLHSSIFTEKRGKNFLDVAIREAEFNAPAGETELLFRFTPAAPGSLEYRMEIPVQDGEVAKAIQILERYCGKSSCLLVGLKSHDQYMKIFRGAMAQTAVAG